MVLGAAVIAVTIALPSVLQQQTWYQSTAVVRFDTTVFPNLVEAGRPGMGIGPVTLPGSAKPGKPAPAFDNQQQNLGEVLKRTKYPTLRQRSLYYSYPSNSEIVITSFGLDPERASAIARDAAEGLTRRIYAIGGLELLQDVLGHEYQAALERRPFQDPEDQLLNQMLQAKAIAGVTPQAGARSLADLSDAERQAVTRALEVQEELVSLNLQEAREALRSTDSSQQALAREQERGARQTITAVRNMLDYMYRTYRTQRSDFTQPAAAFVAQAALPATAIPAYSGLKLAIAALVGAFGGFLTVLIDRQVGVLAKLQELWQYRELIRNMVARDLKARYKNSMLGYVWSLLNPLMMMVVFWVVFSVMIPSGIPMYAVFLIVALLPWNFAVTSVSGGMRSIIDSSNLIKKVYFPREILPIAVVLSNLVNYLFALPVMFLVMAVVQWVSMGQLSFSWAFAFLPVIIVIQAIFLIGVTLLLSTTAVFFRDTTHIIDIFIQLWIFLTPVFFSLEQIATPTWARLVRWLNPMASLIDFIVIFCMVK
jgi:lipopolysaccharide transport system permease protein